MHHLLKTAFVIAGLGLLAGGCSGKSSASSSGGGGGAAPVAAADFPAQLADTYCDTIAPCCDAAHVTYDAATCKSKLMQAGEDAVQKKPGQNYDAAAAGKCLLEFETALRTCQPTGGDDEDSALQDCAKIIVGTAPTGATCTGSRDCASPNKCLFSLDGLTGVCGTDPPPPNGECTSRSCATGSWCNAGACVAQVDSGPCSDSHACSAKSYCDGGQCIPRKADGAACIDDGECANRKCIGGATCGALVLATPASCQGDLE